MIAMGVGFWLPAVGVRGGVARPCEYFDLLLQDIGCQFAL